ncbi:MAG: thioredoxin domain-containing protein, partial [Chloroflexi bacterium]|nr:thioredoxin domain-containing protein [Chloroflexota bacterium]
DALKERLKDASAKLLERRSLRIAPDRDDKVLTSWNGLMLAAFAEASVVLNRHDYREVAEANGAFLLDQLVDESGRLLRTYKDGRAKLYGYLEDYAFLIDGLLLLHEATFGERWLKGATELGRSMVELFWDETSQQFYDTGSDHEDLVIRPRDLTDNAAPAGSSMAVSVLLRLAVLTGDSAYNSRASTSLRSAHAVMQRFPTAAGHWLGALDFYLSKTKEIVIVGERDDRATTGLVREVFRNYLPNRVFIGTSGEVSGDGLDLPLLQDRHLANGRPTAYVCENYVCQLPVNDAGDLAKQLVN